MLLGIYEKFFFHFFPDTLNDFIMPLQPRRMWHVMPILCLPVLVKTLLEFFLNKLSGFSFHGKKLNRFNSIVLLVSILFILSLESFKYNMPKLKKLFDFKPKSPEFFYKLSDSSPYFFGRDKRVLNLDENEKSIDDLYDIYSFIKKYTSMNSAFIHPPYISEFRYLANRQGFVGEKNDGNYAGLNRKFAARYYKMLFLLTEIEYNKLKKPMFQGGENYKLLRENFLNLTEDDIESIKNQFYGYDYFFTEKSHFLKYPVIYENDNFIIYNINS